MEPEVGKLIYMADNLIEKNKIGDAKKLYEQAFELTKDEATKEILREIILNILQ